jgi:hypothetical protein
LADFDFGDRVRVGTGAVAEMSVDVVAVAGRAVPSAGGVGGGIT